MIGFQPEEIPIDCWIQVLERGIEQSSWMEAVPLWGWHCTASFAVDLILTSSSLWDALSFKKLCLGEKLQQVQLGLCSSSFLFSTLRVSKENFTQKELNFPEAAFPSGVPEVWDH